MQAIDAGRPLPDSTIDQLIEMLLDRTKWEAGVTWAQALKLRLSRYSVWSTFNRDGLPYGDLEHLTAEEIASELGFDDADGMGVAWSGDRPLLLFEYDVGGLEIHVPTVVEAWGSDPVNYYFSPAPTGMKWGLTRPWPNAGNEAYARPEVVHDPPVFDSITSVFKENW